MSPGKGRGGSPAKDHPLATADRQAAVSDCEPSVYLSTKPATRTTPATLQAQSKTRTGGLWLIYPLGGFFAAYLLARAGDLITGVLAIIVLALAL